MAWDELVGLVRTATRTVAKTARVDVVPLEARTPEEIEKAFSVMSQEATQLELVLNLKTAKALGITIPPPVLLRAERLIE